MAGNNDIGANNVIATKRSSHLRVLTKHTLKLAKVFILLESVDAGVNFEHPLCRTKVLNKRKRFLEEKHCD